MNRITHYKQFTIHAFESQPTLYRARIRRTDGSNVKNALGDEFELINVPLESSTIEDAIRLAKEFIDRSDLS
jgi:hypothetical protein